MKQNETLQQTVTFKADLLLSPTVQVGVIMVNHSDLKWFVSGGAGLVVLIGNKNTQTVVKRTSGELMGKSETKLTEWSFRFFPSTGVVLSNKWLLSQTYYLPMSVANYVEYNTNHTSTQFTVSYKF